MRELIHLHLIKLAFTYIAHSSIDAQKVTQYVPPPQLASNNPTPTVSPNHTTVTLSTTSVNPNNHTHTTSSHNSNSINKPEDTPSTQANYHVNSAHPVHDNHSMPGSRKTSSAQHPPSVSAPNSRRQSSNEVPLANIRLDPPTNTSRDRVSSGQQENGRGRLFSGRNVSESGIDMGVDGRYGPVDKTSRVSVGAVEL